MMNSDEAPKEQISLPVIINIDNNQDSAHPTSKKPRNRASADQLATLERIFTTSPTPDASTRDHLAKSLCISREYLQIWFQNRRAKQRHLVRKRCEATRQDILRILQCPTPREVPLSFFLTADVISIGHQWRYVAEKTPGALICQYSMTSRTFTWTLRNGDRHQKIEFSISDVLSVELTTTMTDNAMLSFSLLISPRYYSRLPESDTWIECDDFTASAVASLSDNHTLCGPYALLKSQLLHLTQYEPTMRQITTIDGQSIAALALGTTQLNGLDTRKSSHSSSSFSSSSDINMLDTRRSSLNSTTSLLFSVPPASIGVPAEILAARNLHASKTAVALDYSSSVSYRKRSSNEAFLDPIAGRKRANSVPIITNSTFPSQTNNSSGLSDMDALFFHLFATELFDSNDSSPGFF